MRSSGSASKLWMAPVPRRVVLPSCTIGRPVLLMPRIMSPPISKGVMKAASLAAHDCDRAAVQGALATRRTGLGETKVTRENRARRRCAKTLLSPCPQRAVTISLGATSGDAALPDARKRHKTSGHRIVNLSNTKASRRKAIAA